MTMPAPANETAKAKAARLMAEYSLVEARLETATAAAKLQVKELEAAIAIASAPELALLAALDVELKSLALAHGEEVFGDDRRSVIECGLKLQLTETEEVEIDGGEDEACKRLVRALAALGTAPDEQSAAARVALNACLSVKRTINKRFIKENYDETPAWFELLGLRVVAKDSASLNTAPKPRAAKPKPMKAPKAPKVKQPTEEAA